jgi:hypothetical protein
VSEADFKDKVLNIFSRIYLKGPMSDLMKQSLTGYADPNARDFLINYRLIETKKPETVPPEPIPTESGKRLARKLEGKSRQEIEELFFALYPVPWKLALGMRRVNDDAYEYEHRGYNITTARRQAGAVWNLIYTPMPEKWRGSDDTGSYGTVTDYHSAEAAIEAGIRTINVLLDE